VPLNPLIFISKRYLFSRKAKGLKTVNVITIIASFGVFITTAALFIVLSAFSGLRTFNIGLINKTDPDLRILPRKGKVLKFDGHLKKLLTESGIEHYAPVAEDKVLLRAGDKQSVVFLRGVDSTYYAVMHPDSVLIAGTWFEDDLPELTAGENLARRLSLSYGNPDKPVQLLAPKGNGVTGIGFSAEHFFVTGLYRVTTDFEDKYVYAPLNRVRRLLHMPADKVSFVDIRLDKNTDLSAVKKRLAGMLPANVQVKDKFELNRTMFRMLNSENLITYFVGTLILIIAIFNIVGSLIILILKKKKDRFVLWTVGLDSASVRKIFFYYGQMLIALSGFSGLLLGLLAIWLQKKYGFLLVPGTGLVYPVEIRWVNILGVALTVILLAVAGAYLGSYPAKKIEAV